MIIKLCFICVVLMHIANGQLIRKDIMNIGNYNPESKQYEKYSEAENHSEVNKLLGVGDHDLKEHVIHKKLLGEGDHDLKAHGVTKKNMLGGGDHDLKDHGVHKKKLLGRGDHDFKRHSKIQKLIGGGDQVFKYHGIHQKLLGSGDHDYKKHGSHLKRKFIGGGDHDYKKHGKTQKLIGGGDHDYKKHGKTQKLIGGGNHDYKKHEKTQYMTRKKSLDFILLHCESKGLLKKVLKMPHLKSFVDFAKKFRRSYKGCKELRRRLFVFGSNMKKIKLLSHSEKGSATYGVNKFADWTRTEFRKLLGLRPHLRPSKSLLKSAEVPKDMLSSAPKEFDWRTNGVVTPVKNQGMCGSCWAFSVTGNVEGQWAIKHKNLYSLSEQELVDCDKSDDGCNGGLPENAYKAIQELGGLETETDYPYEADDEKCHLNRNKTVVKVIGATEIPQDEEMMKVWLFKNGPISIGINANPLQFYTGGVSHPLKFLCNPKNLDHGMLIVGYGVHRTKYLHRIQPYWLVKNSWGEDWGEKGYYRVYRGDGTCGVNMMATSAVVP